MDHRCKPIYDHLVKMQFYKQKYDHNNAIKNYSNMAHYKNLWAAASRYYSKITNSMPNEYSQIRAAQEHYHTPSVFEVTELTRSVISLIETRPNVYQVLVEGELNDKQLYNNLTIARNEYLTVRRKAADYEEQ
jgi:hypothetical protein